MKLATLAIVSAFSVTGCESILGPGDEPDFSKMNWSSMSVSFWARTSDTKKQKFTLSITDSGTVREGFAKLNQKKVTGYSLAAGDQILLTAVDGKKWQANCVFEDRIDFGKKEDLYYSYNVFTADTEFYDWLRSQCLTYLHESGYLSATTDSVILRSNTDLGRYPVLRTNEAEQGVAPQSATRSESDSEGGDKRQTESEPRPQ